MVQIFMKQKGYMTTGGNLQIKTKHGMDWDNIDSFETFMAELKEELSDGKKKPKVEYVSGHG